MSNIANVCIIGSDVHCLAYGFVMVVSFVKREGMDEGEMLAGCPNEKCLRRDVQYVLPATQVFQFQP